MALRGPKALQEWCRQVTVGYKDVTIKDMSSSFGDGLAFCAIIHHFRPDLIDFDSLKKEDIVHNNQLAFDIAEKKLGIVALLDAPDMAFFKQPDKLSVITYVSSYYNYFKDKMPGEVREKKLDEVVANNIAENEKNILYSPVVSSTFQTPLGDSCQVCSKKVYILERQIVNNKLYHRNCYRCYKCKNTLKPGSYLSDILNGKFECLHCSYDEKKDTSESSPVKVNELIHAYEKNESSPVKVNELIHAYEKSFVNGFASFESLNCNISQPSITNILPETDRKTYSQKSVMKKPNIPVIFKRPKSHSISENKMHESNVDSKESNQQSLSCHEEQKTVIKVSKDILTSLTFDDERPQIKTEEEEEKNDDIKEKDLSESTELERNLSIDKLEERLSSIKISRLIPNSEEQSTNDSESSQISNELILNIEDKDENISEKQPTDSNIVISSSELSEKLPITESGIASTRHMYIKNSRPTRLTPKRFPRHSCPEKKYNTIAVISPPYPQYLNPFEDVDNLQITNSDSLNPFEESDDESKDEENENVLQRKNPFLDEDANDDNIEELLESAYIELDSGAYDSNLNISKPEMTSTPNSNIISSQVLSPDKRSKKKRHAPLPPQILENGIKKYVTLPASSVQLFYGKPPPPPPRIKKRQEGSDNDEKRTSSPSPSKLSLSKQNLESSGSAQTSPRSKKKKQAPLPPVPQKRKVTNLSEFGLPKEAILMELQELDQLQTDLEDKGRELEKQLRKEGDVCSNMEDELLVQWFEIVNEKNKLVRREAELIYIQRQQELEEKHTEVEYELRCLLEKPLSHKTEEDQQREEKLLAELVNIVTERNLIVECIEDERVRQMEEDRGLEEVLSVKGLNLVKKSSKKSKDKSLKKMKKNKKK